jgi:hypothetical protein
MRNFFVEQDRTRVYDEAYFLYVEDVNPQIIPPWRDASEKGPFPDGN